LNVKNVFLYGALEEELYMKILLKFETLNGSQEYGLGDLKKH